jgi:hypothetical protein
MANDILFKYTWEEADAVKGDELKATWAIFSVLWNGESITEIADTKSGSIKEHLNIPLYPLAEWIVLNWWFLLYEPFTPGKYDEQEYKRKHCLAYAREGYALPRLTFQPSGDHVTISWKADNLVHHQIKFINSGETSVRFESYHALLYDFVSKVIERLHTKNISNTLLQQEWNAINSLADDEKKFCRVASSIGIDPFNSTDSQRKEILDAYNVLPQQIIEDFFPSCYRENIKQQVNLALKAIKRIKKDDIEIHEFTQMRQTLQGFDGFGGSPWQEGYEAAKELRKVLKLNGDLLKEFDDIGKAFKIKPTVFRKTVSYERNLPTTISVISGVNHYNSPNLVLGNVKHDARKIKFAYCRAIYEYLFSEDNSISLITRTNIEKQKKNRAFAAEFLVPAEKLREKIDQTFISEEYIDELANEFNVDSLVIRHQVENHNIGQLSYRGF